MQISVRSDHSEVEFRSRDVVIKIGDAIKIADYTLPGPGEYEVRGVMAEAGPAVARLDTGELVIVSVTPPAARPISEHDLEELGAVDVAVIRVGEGGFSPKEAAALIAQVEAPLVIPIARDTEAVNAFCQSGVTCEIQTGPLKVSRASLPTEGTKIIRFA